MYCEVHLLIPVLQDRTFSTCWGSYLLAALFLNLNQLRNTFTLTVQENHVSFRNRIRMQPQVVTTRSIGYRN